MIKAFARLILMCAVPSLGAAQNETTDHTKAEACEILKHHMAQVEGLSGGKPLAEWYCDF